MLSRVQEQIGERLADFTRRMQCANVIAAKKHRADAPEEAIHAARDTCRDRLHAAAESLSVPCLDDQVQVIALDRELRDAEVGALARDREAAAHLLDETTSPERRDIAPDSQRDVRRTA